jgi:hypothetical protein
MAVSDEKQTKHELDGLLSHPRFYFFNLVSCLSYASNQVFDSWIRIP